MFECLSLRVCLIRCTQRCIFCYLLNLNGFFFLFVSSLVFYLVFYTWNFYNKTIDFVNFVSFFNFCFLWCNVATKFINCWPNIRYVEKIKCMEECLSHYRRAIILITYLKVITSYIYVSIDRFWQLKKHYAIMYKIILLVFYSNSRYTISMNNL